MIGISDRDYAALPFENFADQVLRPAVHPLVAPLTALVFQTTERIGLAEAKTAEFRPVEPGFRWGPVWSTAWFRILGRVPGKLRGQRVALRFSSGTEALLWQDGEPRQGFDDNRDTCLLFGEATGGEELELFVEAACNMPLGISTFWWDHPEVQKRWRGEQPGRLESCELVAVNEPLRRFVEEYDYTRRLILALPEDSARCLELLHGMRALTAAMAGRVPDSDALVAHQATLDELLAGDTGAPATTCTAVGHAHLDTAWLWTIPETRRKALRSFANALEGMDRFDSFHFIASQAQQYEWCREDSPELFERIRSRVEEGRWEAGGAMWVEPDCHAPSGEALVRQILVGTTWWREAFGDSAPQTFLFLPDTFGFPASLPQIMRLAGLKTFLTDKIPWSERNVFPHVSFSWRGIDGSEVLAHLLPGTNYNSPVLPENQLEGEARVLRLDATPVGERRAWLDRWLQPFGFGDGGGGPTAETIQRAELGARTGGLPFVKQGTVRQFCDELHAARDLQRGATGRDLAVWDGELYLEQHRGTYTSQAWLKLANSRAEDRLRCVEALLAGSGAAPSAERQERLTAAWKTLLLHQFHDILPGSSIAEVYVYARISYAALEAELEALTAEAAAPWTEGAGRVVFNPTSHPRSAVVELDGEPRLFRALPALGAVAVGSAAAEPEHPVVVGARRLSNGLVTIELDDAGRVARLEAAGCDRPINQTTPDGTAIPLNQLAVYEDRPRRWEAWNVDEDYTDAVTWIDGPADSIETLESGPLRGVLEVSRELGRSRVLQRYSLCADARRVEVELEIDWQEDHRLLRVLFPTGVRARTWTSGILFGHLERPSHRNTSWEQARFEVPGRRWMDLSQPGLGLAVLDQAKVGRSCHDGVLGLSLLRATDFPAVGADRGEHRCRYALLPHRGDWREAGVPREADEHAEPPIILGRPGLAESGEAQMPFELRLGRGDVEIACFKPGHDGQGLILRLCERHGGFTPLRVDWQLPVRTVSAVDLLERPLARELEHDGACTSLTLKPFEIVTLRIELS